MFKVALVNMPFANAQLPPIALAQLRSVLAMEVEGAEAEVFHLNHDFAQDMGLKNYALISNSLETTVTGLGDWFFRKVAFPEREDNADIYARRYMRHFGDKEEMIKEMILDRRESLEFFLDDLIDRYELDLFDAVGFTSMFVQNLANFALAKRLKMRNPDIVTLMGGANCETPMGQVIARNVDMIDFVFSGPGLKSFPEFIGHLVAGDTESCHQMTGVFSKQKLAAQPEETFNEIGGELDVDIPVPLDYDDFLASIDKNFPEGPEVALLFETSRGCWWGERSHCTFCGLNGLTMKYRAMSPDLALSQFESLYSRYYPRVTRFDSVDNILPRNYLTEVLPKLDSPENVTIFYEVKADLKDREMEVLAKAGVTEIQPGIESLATSTLKLMKKGTTAFHNLRFLKNCLVYDIRPAWNLLLGFPGEEEEVYAKYVEDLPSLVHFPPPAGAFPVRFDRFSPYFKDPESYGIKLKPYDFYKLIYPFEEQQLDDLAYFFVDTNYSARHIELVAKWIDKLRQQMDHWHERWNQRDQGLKPRLLFKWRGDSRVIYDSRSGVGQEHEPGELGMQILNILDTPMKPARMLKRLSVSEQELSAELEKLLEKRLVFREGDLWMHLIVEPKAGDESPLAELVDNFEQSAISMA